jgi:hypothetical protein
MKKLVLAMTLSAIVVTPAMAMQENIAQLDDAQLIFQKDELPQELALLSKKEMKETEGAVLPVVVVGAIVGATAGGISYWGSTTNPNLSGLAVAAGTGALGGATGGIIGAGIATFGGLYASQIPTPTAGCTAGRPCPMPK